MEVVARCWFVQIKCLTTSALWCGASLIGSLTEILIALFDVPSIIFWKESNGALVERVTVLWEVVWWSMNNGVVGVRRSCLGAMYRLKVHRCIKLKLILQRVLTASRWLILVNKEIFTYFSSTIKTFLPYTQNHPTQKTF